MVMQYKDKAGNLIYKAMSYNIAQAVITYYEDSKDVDPLLLISDLEASVSYTDDNWLLSRIFNEGRTPEEALGVPHSVAVVIKECYKHLHPREAENAVMDAAKTVKGYFLLELL